MTVITSCHQICYFSNAYGTLLANNMSGRRVNHTNRQKKKSCIQTKDLQTYHLTKCLKIFLKRKQ